jgi:hypothetical protein
MIEPVNEDIRRENTRAIRRRQEWRDRYRLVSQGIRENRQRIRESHRTAGKRDPLAEIQLRSLRLTAHLMMLSRSDITFDLRATAYQWVELGELTQNVKSTGELS